MKIVDRKTFLAMPAGTVFSKYEPCVFGDLNIKGETWENDFLVQQIADAVKCKDSGEFGEILDAAKENGTSFDLDFDNQGRDGCFDDDQLFAVWEDHDLAGLVFRLLDCGEVSAKMVAYVMDERH